jgi:hypothetical protein
VTCVDAQSYLCVRVVIIIAMLTYRVHTGNRTLWNVSLIVRWLRGVFVAFQEYLKEAQDCYVQSGTEKKTEGERDGNVPF